MGAALAICAAADLPELVERLVLIAPAGLPLEKPFWKSLRDFAGQVRDRSYPRDVLAAAALGLARAPRAAIGLARAVRALDLRCECARIRAAGIPVRVVGCATDTLVTSSRARALADALGARYEELGLGGGHMWMLGDRERFAAVVGA